jgi:hypothetical protein
MSGVLNYPQYFWVIQAFESTSGSISNLVNGINTMKSDCSDTTLLGAFMENHDNPRFPSLTSDLSLAKNAIAFTILSDGIPISKLFFKLLTCLQKADHAQSTTAKNNISLAAVFQTIAKPSGFLDTQPARPSTPS